jgi:cell shape-determining protein MreD
MKFVFLFLLFCFAILFESTLVQIPLTLIIFCILTVIYKEEWIFPVSLCSGILLDALNFRPIGATSLFFLLFLFVVFLYEKKFELRSVWFVIFIVGIGSLLFLLIFGHTLLVVQVAVSVGVAVFLFFLFSFLQPLPEKDRLGSWKN